MKIKLILIICCIANSIFGQVSKDSVLLYRENYIHEIEDKFPGNKQDFFDYNQNLIFTAEFRLLKNKKIVELLTANNKFKSYKEFAEIKLMVDGVLHKLIVYQLYPINQSYVYHVFMPFKDFTNGKSSYSGGRYLDLDSRDFKETSILLDFNRAYNPYCAFSNEYSCPIPPKENTLSFEVQAGEKKPLGEHY